MADDTQPDITTLTVQLLSAFVSNNSLPAEGLPDLIKSTRTALTTAPEATDGAPARETYAPAVSVRKSLSSPDHIISLIDGKPYKTLKRHLTTHGLTADQYRERYNLPGSYPLVAPNYSEARRAVAAKLGLGRRPMTPAAAETGDSLTAPPFAPISPLEANAATQKKAATAPAKKRAPKAKAAGPASLPVEAPAAPPKKAPAAKLQGRKRLSIALAQEDAAVSANADVQTQAPVEFEAATQAATPTAKPKTSARKKTNAAAKAAGIKPAAKARSAKPLKNAAELETSDNLAAQGSKAG